MKFISAESISVSTMDGSLGQFNLLVWLLEAFAKTTKIAAPSCIHLSLMVGKESAISSIAKLLLKLYLLKT